MNEIYFSTCVLIILFYCTFRFHFFFAVCIVIKKEKKNTFTTATYYFPPAHTQSSNRHRREYSTNFLQLMRKREKEKSLIFLYEIKLRTTFKINHKIIKQNIQLLMLPYASNENIFNNINLIHININKCVDKCFQIKVKKKTTRKN